MDSGFKESGWRINEIPAFCINLARRPDRWKRFFDQPAVEDLPTLRRFEAVDGKTLDIRNDERIPLLTKRNILAGMRRTHEELDTPGGIGCALSHIGVWEWAVQNQSEVTLVFEDDAVVPPDFVSRANQALNATPAIGSRTDTWDLLLFTDGTRICEPVPGTNFESCDSFIGLQAYCITLDCAKRFLAEAHSLHMHIDLWMAVFKSVHGLRILRFPSVEVAQRGSPTDIQTKEPCYMCDVPTKFFKTHALMRHEEVLLLRFLEAGAIIGLTYWLVRRFV